MTDTAQTWLLPEHKDRERMLDMDRRLQPVRRAALAVLAVALLAMVPWLGWWTFAPLLVAGGMFTLADREIDRFKHPEYLLFASWAGSQTMIAGSVLLSGGADSPALAWLAIPVVTLGARFSGRGVVLGVAITLALLLAVTLGSDASAVIEDPELLVGAMALVIAVAVLSSALMRSDIEHRDEAVVDPLTGMLNRKALDNRVEELRQQAAVSGAPIGLIVIDVDHFKEVNDTVGHSVGDAVLRDVAYIIRKQMRAFELAYRIGGEEFLVLLPGARQPQSARLAEQLREIVAGTRFGAGVSTTISCGVAVSPAGQPLDFEELFCRADRALYEAKRAGRNRVGQAEGPAAEVAELGLVATA